MKSSVTIIEEFTYFKNIFLAKLLKFAVLKGHRFHSGYGSRLKSFWQHQPETELSENNNTNNKIGVKSCLTGNSVQKVKILSQLNVIALCRPSRFSWQICRNGFPALRHCDLLKESSRLLRIINAASSPTSKIMLGETKCLQNNTEDH